MLCIYRRRILRSWTGKNALTSRQFTCDAMGVMTRI